MSYTYIRSFMLTYMRTSTYKICISSICSCHLKRDSVLHALAEIYHSETSVIRHLYNPTFSPIILPSYEVQSPYTEVKLKVKSQYFDRMPLQPLGWSSRGSYDHIHGKFIHTNNKQTIKCNNYICSINLLAILEVLLAPLVSAFVGMYACWYALVGIKHARVTL